MNASDHAALILMAPSLALELNENVLYKRRLPLHVHSLLHFIEFQ